MQVLHTKKLNSAIDQQKEEVGKLILKLQKMEQSQLNQGVDDTEGHVRT